MIRKSILAEIISVICIIGIISIMLLMLTLVSCTEDLNDSSDSNDPNALPAPTNLKAVVGMNLSGNQTITLTFTPVSGATYYTIYQSIDPTWKDYIILDNIMETTHSFPYYTSDPKLLENTTYYFKVACKQSYSSDASKLTSPVSCYVGFLGVTGVSITALSNSSIELTWKPKQGVSKYRIYRGKSSNSSSMEPLVDIDASTTTYTDTALNSNTYYYYRISAIAIIEGEEHEGLLSDYAYTSTNAGSTAMIPAPTNLTASVNGRTIILQWDKVVGASSYYIYISLSEDGPYGYFGSLSASTGTTVYYVASITAGIPLSANTKYYFKVSTILGGDMSESVSATTGS